MGEDLHESVKNVRKLVRKAKRDVLYVLLLSRCGREKELMNAARRNGGDVDEIRFLSC